MIKDETTVVAEVTVVAISMALTPRRRDVTRGHGRLRTMAVATAVAATTVADVATVAEAATVVALPERGGSSHATYEHTDDGSDGGGDGGERDDVRAVPRGPRSPARSTPGCRPPPQERAPGGVHAPCIAAPFA